MPHALALEKRYFQLEPGPKIWNRTSRLRPPSQKTGSGRQAAQPYHRPPGASNPSSPTPPRRPVKRSPPPLTDIPAGMQAAGSAWLNTLVDYDTNKSIGPGR